MTSFQNDLLLTIYNSHNLYEEKINDLFNDKSITQNLSLDESDKLIKYIKNYKKQINQVNNTIDNILNIKKASLLDEKIEQELLIKILPIMNVYRTLLYEKYTSYSKNNYPNLNTSNISTNINEQD